MAQAPTRTSSEQEAQADTGKLLVDREERFELIRNAKFSLPGVRSLCHVYDLLEAIEVCTGNEKCNARIEVLAAKMHCSARTVERTIGHAKQLGVLQVTESIRVGGQGPNIYQINWAKLAKWGVSTEPAKPKAKRPKTQKSAARTSTPKVATVDVEAPTANGEEWKAALAALEGLFDARWLAVERAKANGATAAEVIALAGHARAHGGYTPGAIYNRVCNQTPGMPIDRGWPDIATKETAATPAKVQSAYLADLQRERAQTEEANQKRKAFMLFMKEKGPGLRAALEGVTQDGQEQERVERIG